jgi:hypothetical protein
LCYILFFWVFEWNILASVLLKYIVRVFCWSTLCQCTSEVHCASVLVKYIVRVF